MAFKLNRGVQWGPIFRSLAHGRLSLVVGLEWSFRSVTTGKISLFFILVVIIQFPVRREDGSTDFLWLYS